MDRATVIQVVYAGGNNLNGIGYRDGAPVITRAVTDHHLLPYVHAQHGEAVLTESGWYHVNDSGAWSQADDLYDCGQFVRSFEDSDFTYEPEDLQHLLDFWMYLAGKRVEQNSIVEAACWYAAAEGLAWVSDLGGTAAKAHTALRSLDAKLAEA